MNREETAQKYNEQWFRGAPFGDPAADPEYEQLARRFLCGDVLPRGTLTQAQKALVILAGQQHRLDLLTDRARQFSQQGHTLRKVENKRAYNRTSALKKFFRSCHAANRCSHILEQGLS